VVFDTPARVIELGELERFFTGGLRRVIEIRDRHCHPGCYVPANFCQVDHIVEWAKGGETNQSNGRLLCPVHNRRRNTPITPIPLGLVPDETARDGPSP